MQPTVDNRCDTKNNVIEVKESDFDFLNAIEQDIANSKHKTDTSSDPDSFPFDVAVTVEDLHDPIAADEPYTRLKEAVIQRVAKSTNRMLRELFTQVELGDQTPSQLVRHMRSLLTGRHREDAIFRKVWLEKLPLPMQQVLAMLDSNTHLEKLATHADSIKECYPIGASCSNIQQPPPSKGKPHQGIALDSEGPALSEHDTPYTEKAPCCCTARRAPTSAGPPRTPIDAYCTDYDDLRGTVCLLCTQEAKKALADATILHHLNSDAHAQLILTTDASITAVDKVLHQQLNNQLQPLAFFSQKLKPAQTRYSTFSRELLAIHLAIRHFRHLLEGRDFSVHTDHKPLTYALKAKPDRYSPREVRHLDYISQFTAVVRYIRGSDNVVANALSRPDINTLTSGFDLAKLADLQTADESIAD
nr:unnamed protein product [Spirometra erinaceieuropaei]